MAEETEQWVKNIWFKLALLTPLVTLGASQVYHCYSKDTLFCEKKHPEDFAILNLVGCFASLVMLAYSYWPTSYSKQIEELKYKNIDQIYPAMMKEGSFHNIKRIAEDNLSEINNIASNYELSEVKLDQIKGLGRKITFLENVDELEECIEQRKLGFFQFNAKKSHLFLLGNIIKHFAITAFSGCFLYLFSDSLSNKNCRKTSSYAYPYFYSQEYDFMCQERNTHLKVLAWAGVCYGATVTTLYTLALFTKWFGSGYKDSPTVLMKKVVNEA